MVVAIHHSAVLIIRDNRRFRILRSFLSSSTLCEELLLEVLEQLLEGISTILLGQCLLGDVIGGLIQLFIHAGTEVFVVHLVVVLALHVLAQLLRELSLQFAHGFDGLHSGFQGTKQILLRNFLHLAFHHHDVLG